MCSFVRFCGLASVAISMTFVRASARLKALTPFMENQNMKFQFDAQFQYVIKDCALHDFYRKRQLSNVSHGFVSLARVK